MIPMPLALAPSPIPPTLHMVWVGSTPPYWVEQSFERWASALDGYPRDWRFLRWTDASIKDTVVERVAEEGARHGLHPRGIADLIRIYAVGFHGGFYMDVDMVPLGVELPVGHTGWVMSLPEQRESSRVLCNGAFGFYAGHPFLTHVAEHAEKALAKGVTNEHFVAGPRAFRYSLDRAPVQVDWTLQFWKKKAERAAMTAGAEIPLSRLRAESLDSRVIHVGSDWKEPQ